MDATVTYRPRLAPRAHQVEALRRVARGPRAYAWLMEMGTGKTKVILDEWGTLVTAGRLDNLLVVAPAGSYRNWWLDREGYPGEITKQLDVALRARTAVGAWESGPSQAKLRALEALLAHRGPRILCVNVEALSTTKAARVLCERFLDSGRTMMVVDESTTIKSPDAKRTKQVIALGKAATARRIATGLVAPRSPLDLYTQFEFLDWRLLGFRSYYAFRARYAVMQKMYWGGRWVHIVVSYRHVEELQRMIAPYSYRVLKEECLDLDPKVYATRDVPLTEEQARLYSELKEFATAALDEETHVTATAVITQVLRLHQLVCGHVVDEQGAVHDVAENRTKALLDLLDEHEGKAVIWVTYGRTLEKVAAALRAKLRREAELDQTLQYDDGMVATYWGGNASTRAEAEHRFKTDPRCRWMVATPGAGGLGNTWVAANLVVYYANTYDLGLRFQSEDRTHREGQTRSVTYVDLVARGTVDERIIAALRDKIDLATTITGENYREWLV